MTTSRPKLLLLGRITGAHGIRGEVVVRSFADIPEDIAAYGPLSDAEGKRRFALTLVRVTPKGAVIARIKGVEDRTGAERLAGVDLYIERDRLADADDSEFYHADLIGLDVVTDEGVALGQVIAIQNYGAGDLLEIRIAGSKTSELVPFTDAFVPEVNLERGRVVVALPAEAAAPDVEDR